MTVNQHEENTNMNTDTELRVVAHRRAINILSAYIRDDMALANSLADETLADTTHGKETVTYLIQTAAGMGRAAYLEPGQFEQELAKMLENIDWFAAAFDPNRDRTGVVSTYTLTERDGKFVIEETTP